MKTLIKNLEKEIKLRKKELEVAKEQFVRAHLMGRIYGLETAIEFAERSK